MGVKVQRGSNKIERGVETKEGREEEAKEERQRARR